MVSATIAVITVVVIYTTATLRCFDVTISRAPGRSARRGWEITRDLGGSFFAGDR
jgi:hypothetical protein